MPMLSKHRGWLEQSMLRSSGCMRPNGLLSHLIELKQLAVQERRGAKQDRKENDNENARSTESSLGNRQGQHGTGVVVRTRSLFFQSRPWPGNLAAGPAAFDRPLVIGIRVECIGDRPGSRQR